MKANYRYFPVSDTQKAWGLYATCVGRARSEAGTEFPSRAHPDEYYFTWERGRVLREWQLILVEEGRGEAEFADGRRAALPKGTLLSLAPGAWHRYRPDPATGWATLWIGFGGEIAARLMAAAGFGAECAARGAAKTRHTRSLFAATVAETLESGLARPCATSARIFALLAALAEAPDAGGGADARTRRSELARRARAYIAEHCNGVIDFSALAASLGLPYRTFRHIFAKECGMPPLRYQLETKLSRAKNLLASSDIPVAEIASLLGFNSPYYFAHFFQRETGMSAMRFRARRRGIPAGVG